MLGQHGVADLEPVAQHGELRLADRGEHGDQLQPGRRLEVRVEVGHQRSRTRRTRPATASAHRQGDPEGRLPRTEAGRLLAVGAQPAPPAEDVDDAPAHRGERHEPPEVADGRGVRHDERRRPRRTEAVAADPNTTLLAKPPDPHPVEAGEPPELERGDHPEQHQSAGQRPAAPTGRRRPGRSRWWRSGPPRRRRSPGRGPRGSTTASAQLVTGPLRVAEGLGVASTFHVGKYA